MHGLNSKIQEARKLLQVPNGENLAAATQILEAISVELSVVHSAVQRGDVCPANLKLELYEFSLQFRSVRTLLETAAKFFSGLSGLRQSPAYQQNGLLTTEQYTRRTLARL